MFGPACDPGELKLTGHPIMVLRGAYVSRGKDIGVLADVAMTDMAPTVSFGSGRARAPGTPWIYLR